MFSQTVTFLGKRKIKGTEEARSLVAERMEQTKRGLGT